MGLVECIECGNMISENAVSCPNCGALASKSVSYCPYCELLKNQKMLMVFSKENKCFICPKCSKTVGFATSEEEAQIEQNRRSYEIQNSNNIKCPTCGSTNIQKIGTGERVVSVATLGIFSNKINKNFKCKNCGYTW